MGKFSTMEARPSSNGIGRMIISGFFDEYMRGREQDRQDERKTRDVRSRNDELELANMQDEDGPGNNMNFEDEGIMLNTRDINHLVGPAGTGSYDEKPTLSQIAMRMARMRDDKASDVGFSSLKDVMSGKASQNSALRYTSSPEMYKADDGRLFQIQTSNIPGVPPRRVYVKGGTPAQKVISDDIGGSIALRGEYDFEPKATYLKSLSPNQETPYIEEAAEAGVRGRVEEEKRITDKYEYPIAVEENKQQGAEVDRMKSLIERAKDRTNILSVGIASQLSGGVGGSPASKLNNVVSAIRSDLTIRNLKGMRSKLTGATGFGSTQQKEFEVIQDKIARLNPEELGTEGTLELLDDIMNHYDNIQGYMNGDMKAKYYYREVSGEPGQEQGSQPSPGDRRKGANGRGQTWKLIE